MSKKKPPKLNLDGTWAHYCASSTRVITSDDTCTTCGASRPGYRDWTKCPQCGGEAEIKPLSARPGYAKCYRCYVWWYLPKWKELEVE